MLSRGGAGAAMQKIVATVHDLPSPLDAQPGERIIVRETSEVYGLNANTRMWESIGTLKKVGGMRPEELKEHIETEGNPHGTSLQDVLDKGAAAKVTEEITISGKGPMSQVRLLSGSAALRVGPDAGSREGLLWLNVGSGKKTILRAVNSDGDDMLTMTTEGIVSGGSATFHGGFKGLAEFEDEIVASEGLFGAEGYDLVLGGDKGVVLKVGGRERAVLTDGGFAVKGQLKVASDLTIGGLVHSNLSPSGDRTLGSDKARWKSAAIGSLDMTGALFIRVQANARTAPLQVIGAVPGDSTVLTSGGELGLGTTEPERRLDVRGDGLVVGSGEARISINDTIDYNRGADGKAQDPSSAVWRITPGGRPDAFTVTRNGADLFHVDEKGAAVTGTLRVSGDLNLAGHLKLGGVEGLSGQSITFTKKRSAYLAQLHAFSGQVFVESDAEVPFAVGEALVIDGGNLIGSGTLGTAARGWESAFLKKNLVVGATELTDGVLKHASELTLDAPSVVAGPELRLTGKQPKVSALNELRLAGQGGSALFSMGGPACGLSFEGKSWDLKGVTSLEAGAVRASSAVFDGEGTIADFKDGGRSVASISKEGLQVAGGLSLGRLAFKSVTEEVSMNGLGTRTRFELPAGVRIEAVVVKLLSDVTGARFLQVGDLNDPDRFASPSTELKSGSVIRGLNHWGLSRAVQKTKGPITITGDAPATGKLRVTVHYVDPAA